MPLAISASPLRAGRDRSRARPRSPSAGRPRRGDRTRSRCRAPVRGIPQLHRVGEAAGLVHDRHRAVAQAVHLVEAARLVARRHQEHVGAGLDQVRELVREAVVEADLARERARELARTAVSNRGSPLPSTTSWKPCAAQQLRQHARRAARSPSGRRAATRCRSPARRASYGRPHRSRAAPACRRALPARSSAVKRCGISAIALGAPLVVVDAVEDADDGRRSRAQERIEPGAVLRASGSRARRSG